MQRKIHPLQLVTYSGVARQKSETEMQPFNRTIFLYTKLGLLEEVAGIDGGARELSLIVRLSAVGRISMVMCADGILRVVVVVQDSPPFLLG